MPKVYAIVEWFERFEVNSSNRAASEGDKLRVSPLQHVRHKAKGHNLGFGYRRLKDLAGKRRLASVLGVWLKVTELAAIHHPEQRGMLLNERNEPATVEEMALMFEFDAKQVKFGLECLCSVGWVFLAEFEGFSCNPLNSAEAAKSAKFSPKRSETKRSEAKLNETKENGGRGSNLSRSASARLQYDTGLQQVLKPKTASDKAAYRNLCSWLAEQGDGYFERAMKIAADSKSGRNPMAVFFSRLDSELGYRPSVIRQKKGVL